MLDEINQSAYNVLKSSIPQPSLISALHPLSHRDPPGPPEFTTKT